MGRETKYFRQSKKSLSGNAGARNFSQVVRSEGWHAKIQQLFKVRGKKQDIN